MSIVVLFATAVIVVAAVWYVRRRGGARVPEALRPGRQLPDFSAVTEQGDPVRSTDLVGSATVMLFVRGSWCPFCSAQVEQLTAHYKAIVNLGAKLILVTPKPLETTRRVAEFFDVEFDFWLDESLAAARRLGLVLENGVPDDFHREYGRNTIWPAAVVVDPAGIIRYTAVSRKLNERPDPEDLLSALSRVSAAT